MAVPVKTWGLVTVDGKPYRLAVMTDASLWLQFGTSPPAQLDPVALGNAMTDVTAVIASIVSANALCPHTRALPGTTYILTCDLPNNHKSVFHHDPASGVFWLADA
jgi:hypothetical protein